VSSKSDEVLIFGRTGVEMYSQGPVYMQSNKVGITLQDNQIFLGQYDSNIGEAEPLVLGLQLNEWLSDLTLALSNFSSTIAPTVSQPEGTILETINLAATTLQDDVETLNGKLSQNILLSQTTNTI
jgi:hypothetical protein